MRLLAGVPLPKTSTSEGREAATEDAKRCLTTSLSFSANAQRTKAMTTGKRGAELPHPFAN